MINYYIYYIIYLLDNNVITSNVLFDVNGNIPVND